MLQIQSQSANESTPLLGSQFGQYEIIGRLGAGGMAEIWLATMKGACGFERRVVIKTMLPNHAEDPELVQMFVREAMLAAQLDHPGIIQIFDLGLREGTYFIAMEHVIGCSLRQIRRRAREVGRRLPLALPLQVIADCCESLEYAHQLTDGDGKPMGLIHRDISPDNIMVSFTGHTKVLDFGVATAKDHSRTRVGTIKGKYPYMAPEVLRGAPDSALRDIYSIGVVLYELLTDSRPFSGRSDAEVIYKILHEKPTRPRTLNPEISERLEAIIVRAMAPEVRERYAEAGELGKDLRALIRAEIGEMRRPELGAFVSLLFPERDDIPSAIRRLMPGAEQKQQPAPRLRSGGIPELEIEIFTDDFEEVFSEPTNRDEPRASRGRRDTGRLRTPPGPPTPPASLAAALATPAAQPDVEDGAPPAPGASGDGPAGEPREQARAAAYVPSAQSAPSAGTGPASGAAGPDDGAAALDADGRPEQPSRALASIWQPRSLSGRGEEGTGDIFAPFPGRTRTPWSSAERGRSDLVERQARKDSRDWWTRARAEGGARGDTSFRREDLEAARHFDQGLHLLRNRDYEGARNEWEIAARMAPENKVYEVNLRRLKASMEST